jgi:hypothetical protein
MSLSRLTGRLAVLAVLALVLLSAVPAGAATADRARARQPDRTVLHSEKTYEIECGDHQCLMRATPGLSGGGDFNLFARWRLRTYRWISGVGWQLSTSQSITCNKCSMNRVTPAWRGDYFGSVANAYDQTWQEPGAGHATVGNAWFSSQRRMSWRDWRGIAHYWPCQTCGDLTTVVSNTFI